MNSSNPAMTTISSASRPHPLYLVAATAVTIASMAAVAHYAGWLPAKDGVPAATATTTPAPVTAEAPAAPAVPATSAPAVQPKPAAPVAKSGAGVTAPKPVSVAPPPPPRSAPVASVPPVPPAGSAPAAMPPAPAATSAATPAGGYPAPPLVCRDCGVIDRIDVIEAEGKPGVGGAIVGGVLGAVVGNQIGNGGARDVARVLGAAGGAYAGHQIEKSNSKAVRYETVVRFDDGSTQRFASEGPPTWRNGDQVRLVNGQLVPRR